MAKRKRSAKRPQPQHPEQKKSQHDRRKRLQHANPNRKKTTHAKVPLVGVIALSLRSLLYVRKVNLPKLTGKYDWEFRTKHKLGVELLTWFVKTIRMLGGEAKAQQLVDDAYAARPLLCTTNLKHR